MDLATYISDPGRRDDLAAAIPTSPQYLWQMATGWRNKRPSRLMAEAIERVTGGAVTREELRPDIFGPPPTEPPVQAEESRDAV